MPPAFPRLCRDQTSEAGSAKNCICGGTPARGLPGLGCHRPGAQSSQGLAARKLASAAECLRKASRLAMNVWLAKAQKPQSELKFIFAGGRQAFSVLDPVSWLVRAVSSLPGGRQASSVLDPAPNWSELSAHWRRAGSFFCLIQPLRRFAPGGALALHVLAF